MKKYAIAACVVVLLFGMSIGGYAYYKTPVAYLSLDINPSVELGVNALNYVVSATGYNTDGKTILDGQNVINFNVKDTVNKLVKSASDKGFIASDGSTIVSVISETKNLSTASMLENYAEQGVNEAIKSTGEIVVVYKDNVDISKRNEAKKLGITPGKLNLIQELQVLDPTITIDKYKDATVTEIIKKAAEIKKPSETVSSASRIMSESTYSTASSSSRIIAQSTYPNVVSKTPSVGATPVSLGTAGNYAILAKSGISTVPSSVITGNIGVSPISATAITGFTLTQDATNAFSTSTQLTGKAYAADYASPTSSNLTIAVGNMGTAYTDAAGRAANYTELYTGDISGKTLTSGVYKWGTGVLINSDVTLNGGPNDVFIFQIAKGITQAANTRIILSGGVQAKNIFWQTCETVAIGTGSHFEGIILGGTNITLGTHASITGRLLAQTAVTLIMNTVVAP